MHSYSLSPIVETINKIWVTWERQRRSIVLSKEFDAAYYELISNKSRIGKYIYLGLKTIHILIKKKPDVLFVQNPSIVLTFLACLFRICYSNIVLVVDRHSNFFPISKSSFVNNIHNQLSKFTLKTSDLTIVTNNILKDLVESLGGKSVALEDKIPNFRKNKNVKLKGKHNLLYVCSFDPDEPYFEVINAAHLIESDIYIYVTGNFNKVKDKNILKAVPHNVIMLGYIPDEDYFDYMYAADGVIVLTTWDHTLLCGAYEAINAGKPLVLSDKEDLIRYFNKGVIKTENNPESISQAIKDIIIKKRDLEKEIRILKQELTEDWQVKFKKVKEAIETILQEKVKKS